MDQYNKRTKDSVHEAIGLAAGGLLLATAYTLATKPAPTSGGPPPPPPPPPVAVNIADQVIFTIPGQATQTHNFTVAQLLDHTIDNFIKGLPPGTFFDLRQVWQRPDGSIYYVDLATGTL